MCFACARFESCSEIDFIRSLACRLDGACNLLFLQRKTGKFFISLFFISLAESEFSHASFPRLTKLSATFRYVLHLFFKIIQRRNASHSVDKHSSISLLDSAWSVERHRVNCHG